MGKKWCAIFAACLLILMVAVGSVTVIVDPYFHYHAPLDRLEYPIVNQRYQNDGIVKNFDYDAIITGTSMTENFKASEADELFGVKSVKVSLSGGSFKEVNDMVARAIRKNPRMKMVIRSLDLYMLFYHKDYFREEFEYPFYLYDNNLFNDVQYIYNKDVLLGAVNAVFEHTASGEKTVDFDTYSKWDHKYEFSKEAVLRQYERPEKSEDVSEFTSDDEIIVKENVLQNIITEAKKNPDIQFYYFVPPYSAVWWDQEVRTGNLERQIAALEMAAELLVKVENIRLFSFAELVEMTEDLDNYKDSLHYSPEINSFILKSMKNEEYMLTDENYEKYWQNILDYYRSFDFEQYFRLQEYDLIRQNAQRQTGDS